jgi:hypothetical protein
MARFELYFLRPQSRSRSPGGNSVEGEGLNAPTLYQEAFVACSVSVVLQPVQRVLDEGKEHAGSSVDVRRGDAGKRALPARQQSSGTVAAVFNLGDANLERTLNLERTFLC